jgi:hypothetical protein
MSTPCAASWSLLVSVALEKSVQGGGNRAFSAEEIGAAPHRLSDAGVAQVHRHCFGIASGVQWRGDPPPIPGFGSGQCSAGL